MKILVPVRRVPNPDVKVRLKGDGSGIDTEGVNFLVNPFDEYAIEEAVQIVEKSEGEVVLVTIGTGESAADSVISSAPSATTSPSVARLASPSMIASGPLRLRSRPSSRILVPKTLDSPPFTKPVVTRHNRVRNSQTTARMAPN